MSTQPITTEPIVSASIQPIVSATDVHRRYGEGEAAVDALAGVTAAFPAGRFAAIMGPSGSGKSTLMHILAGLDRPTSGTVTLDGVTLNDLNDDKLTLLRRDRVGFIFQTFNLLPVLTAEENILLPLWVAKHLDRQARLDFVYEVIGEHAEMRHRKELLLSGGQQKLVALGRALAIGTRCLLLDEPYRLELERPAAEFRDRVSWESSAQRLLEVYRRHRATHA